MKKLFLAVTTLVALCTLAGAAELFYPQGDTFIVARVRSMDKLVGSYDKFRAWFESKPALADFWAPLSKKFLGGNLKQVIADALEVSPKEFEGCFTGSVTLIVGGASEEIAGGKDPQAALVVDPTTEAGAKNLEEILKGSEEVEKAEWQEGVVGCWRITLRPEPATGKEKDKDAPAAKEDWYMLREGARVWLSSSQDFLTSVVQSQPAGFTPDFFRKANSADIVGWVDPKPFVSLVKQKLEQKTEGKPASPVDPAILDKLGLDTLSGIGFSVSIDAMEVRVEVASDAVAAGVFKLLRCAPSGLEPSVLIPAAADEFTIGRFDLDCLWTELKDVAKTIMPATETIYKGWQKQIQDTYGVAIDKQLFGSLGTHYASYSLRDEQGGRTKVIFVEMRDCVAFQQGLEAFIHFFSQGKEFFDKETIANTPVWRLKGQLQKDSETSLSYAITPRWLIICAGGPNEMANVLEVSQNGVLSPLWKTPAVKSMNDQGTPLTSFSYQSFSTFLESIASAALEVDYRDSAKTGSERLWDTDELPDFSSIAGSLTFRVYNQPGLITTLLKFNVEK